MAEFYQNHTIKINSLVFIQPLRLQWFGQFSGRDSLNDAVITKGFILGAIFCQGLARSNTVRHIYWIDKIVSRCSSVIGWNNRFLMQVSQWTEIFHSRLSFAPSKETKPHPGSLEGWCREEACWGGEESIAVCWLTVSACFCWMSVCLKWIKRT